MNISNRTIQRTMRIFGYIILVLAVALTAYLAWITGNVGLDMFLFMAFGVGILSIVVATAMIYLSFNMTIEQKEEIETEYIYRRKQYVLARKCS